MRLTLAPFAALVAILAGIWKPGLLTAQEGVGEEKGFIITTDGVRLHYHRLGKGTPIVIVPAGFFLERDFAPLAHGGTVVFYDMRGRGRSDPVNDSARVSIGLEVTDLDAVRQHVHAVRFVAVRRSYISFLRAEGADADRASGSSRSMWRPGWWPT
jgi:hypothetical protein